MYKRATKYSPKALKVGTYFIFEDAYMAASQVGGAAYELIRDHVFMTIPLFVLM